MNALLAYALLFAPFVDGPAELTIKTDEVKIKFIGDKETEGTIGGFKATIQFDVNDVANSSISGTVDVNTLDTDTPKRDEHLKSADYFDAKKYPTMGFKSTSIKLEGDEYIMMGKMTIKDVEHEEKIHFTFAENLFKGSCSIHLSNYKVGSYANKKPEDTVVKIRFYVPVS